VQVLPWFRDVIEVLYGQVPRQTVVSVPRGNGKTTLAAALGLYELLGRGLTGAQVLTVATSWIQARIVFDLAMYFVRQSERLTSWSEPEYWVYPRRKVPELNSFMMALPARDPAALQGYTPTLGIVDEMGFIDARVWAAMQQGAAKSEGGKALGIGTPGFDRHGVMYTLRSVARERRPKGLQYLEWSAPEGCAVTDRAGWRKANPGLGTVKQEQALEDLVPPASTEEDFRTFQLGQWVGAASRWLPWEAWEGLNARAPAPADGEPVVLGFDGSESRDSTALCWATREAVGVVRVWERVDDPAWRVPRDQVVAEVLAAFERWDVRLLACDPAGWRTELEDIEREVGERLERVPWAGYAKFAPACDRFYTAVTSGALSWDGSAVLSRHLHNAVPVRTPRGTAVDKAYHGGKDKIDAGVAAILAYEYASRLLVPQPPEPSLEGAIW
jgi:phage terminase large subunit-like protein